jgi:hypothetical protein
MKKPGRLHAVGVKLKEMKDAGVRKIVVFYTKNGKPNYMKIGLTAAIVAAAAGGAYMLYKHRKHGHVIVKKNAHGVTHVPPAHEAAPMHPAP